MRWDGRAWSRVDSGTSENLYAIAGCVDDDSALAVAVGGDLHIGGSSLIASRAVAREAASAVGPQPFVCEASGMQHILLAVAHGPLGWFAAGYNGGIVRGGPGAWARVDVTHYSHVFALACSEKRAFAVGLGGTMLMFDGETWRPIASRVDEHLRGAYALGDCDVLCVGLSGTIVRYDGHHCTPMRAPARAHLEGVWARSPREAYAAGLAGAIFAYDGAAWSAMTQPDGATRNFHAIHGSSQ